ncbi:hypothetical protein EON65_48310 [archaeon]|nr:MAG: hypothetical protein EON65_48310 [archaeon]
MLQDNVESKKDKKRHKKREKSSSRDGGEVEEVKTSQKEAADATSAARALLGTTITATTNNESISPKTNSANEQPGSSKRVRLQWNFVADYNDHFETPPVAYRDIQPVLSCICESKNKTAKDLTIYDPYYCQGAMLRHMRDLGFENVINRNRDFYNDIKHHKLPGTYRCVLMYGYLYYIYSEVLYFLN